MRGASGPPGSAIIHALRWLAPHAAREEWCDEWTAELAHCDAPAWRCRLRATGALFDALWLRRHGDHAHLGSTMLAHDLRYATRTLLRRPLFTTIVVATLATCIGASSAVFSIVNGVLLHGLAYRDQGSLVAVWSDNPREKTDRYEVSVGDYLDWRRRSQSFEQLAGYFPIWNAIHTSPDAAERIDVGAVSANFLRTLGVRPLLGRDFIDGEDLRGAAPVVIVSQKFRTRTFGRDAAVIGRTITLDGQSCVVVGVMGPDFSFPQNAVDVIAPLPVLGSYLDRRGVHLLSVIGRLGPEVSIDQARREMAPIAAQLRQEHPQEDAGLGITVVPLTDDLLGGIRRPIVVLFAAVCAVLLVGCANVASLMLSRAVSRRQEFAVRSAMGAPPGAIARQLLTESAVIALAAGVLGIAIAFGATRALATMLPPAIARVGTVHVDLRVLAFTLATCAVVALLCGIVPAVRGMRSVRGLRGVGGAARDAFPDAARGGTSGLHGRGARRLHAALVVGELTLAMVLAVSAGLLMKSFARLTAVDPGFRTSRIVRMKIDLPSPAYTRGRRTDQFFETVLRETSALPGVRSAALVSRFPLHDGSLTSNVLAQGAVYREGVQLPTAEYRLASPGYFETMGIPLIAGRDFQSTDTADSSARHVAIINQAAAVAFFGTPNPLGKWLRLGGPTQPRFTVVGVIGDIHDLSLRDAPKPEVYISSHQGLPGSGTIVIRYDGAAPSIVDGVRRIVSALDRGVPVFDVQSIEAVMDAARVSERFTTTLLSGFALLALLLAAVGTYGVVAFGVAERTREIGVRMALGARSGDVLGMVLREGVLLFVMALPLALVGVWLAGRMVASLLFGVVSSDPATIAGSVLILGAATAVACFIPALRASRVDPTTAIRA